MDLNSALLVMFGLWTIAVVVRVFAHYVMNDSDLAAKALEWATIAFVAILALIRPDGRNNNGDS